MGCVAEKTLVGALRGSQPRLPVREPPHPSPVELDCAVHAPVWLITPRAARSRAERTAWQAIHSRSRPLPSPVRRARAEPGEPAQPEKPGYDRRHQQVVSVRHTVPYGRCSRRGRASRATRRSPREARTGAGRERRRRTRSASRPPEQKTGADGPTPSTPASSTNLPDTVLASDRHPAGSGAASQRISAREPPKRSFAGRIHELFFCDPASIP